MVDQAEGGMRMASPHFRGLVAVSALVALVAGSALAADPIGHVKSATGSVVVDRDNSSSSLAVGQDIFNRDVIRTGASANLGITFRDDTTLSMGPDSRLVIDEMVFDPARDRMSMGMKMLKGTFAMIAGQIPRLAPERTAISTPTMTIGIRGTSFLVEVSDAE